MPPLKHLSPESIIRRPPGLTDKEWDKLILLSVKKTLRKATETTFMRELVNVLLAGEINEKVTVYLLEMLGVNRDALSSQNWEHIESRFFRHFCPENLRNAINHAMLPRAELTVCHDGRLVTEFRWMSEKQIELRQTTDLTDSIDAMIGDTITVIAYGYHDIESVRIYTNSDSIEYYSKGRTKSFGDIMYKLKKTMLANR